MGRSGETWVDLVIGARAPITSRIDAFARADVGGFGVGSSSTLAWNVLAGEDYQLNRSASLVAGHRVLDINRSSGGGATAFEANVRMYGAFAALALRF